MSWPEAQRRRGEGGSPTIGPVAAERRRGGRGDAESVAIIGFAGAGAVIARGDGSLELVGIHELRVVDPRVVGPIGDEEGGGTG